MNLQSDDFTLFDLPQTFVQDRDVVDQRWRDLQREAHPDRFAASPTTAQRLAMQWSVRINEAYRRLKDPLRRAAYLCELHGALIDAESNTAMPPQFLLKQMEWREALDEADDAVALEALQSEVRRSRREALEACARLIDQEHDYAAAARQVRALMFITRFGDDVEDRIDQLGQ